MSIQNTDLAAPHPQATFSRGRVCGVLGMLLLVSGLAMPGCGETDPAEAYSQERLVERQDAAAFVIQGIRDDIWSAYDAVEQLSSDQKAEFVRLGGISAVIDGAVQSSFTSYIDALESLDSVQPQGALASGLQAELEKGISNDGVERAVWDLYGETVGVGEARAFVRIVRSQPVEAFPSASVVEALFRFDEEAMVRTETGDILDDLYGTDYLGALAAALGDPSLTVPEREEYAGILLETAVELFPNKVATIFSMKSLPLMFDDPADYFQPGTSSPMSLLNQLEDPNRVGSAMAQFSNRMTFESARWLYGELQGEFQQQRKAVIGVLSGIPSSGRETGIALCIQALAVPNDSIQGAALSWMRGNLSVAEINEAFLSHFAERDSYSADQIDMYVEVLAGLNRSRDTDFLVAVRSASMRYGDTLSLPWIVKYMCIEVLADIGGPDSIAVLRRFQNDTDGFIRTDDMGRDVEVEFSRLAQNAIASVRAR